MNPRHGKLIARWSVALGLAVLVACGVAFRDRIAEEWWLYKLESGELEEQKVAAEKLVEMGSVRAVPVMLENLHNVYEEQPHQGRVFSVLDGSVLLILRRLSQHTSTRCFLVIALIKIVDGSGQGCVRHLVVALDDDHANVRDLAAGLLYRIGPEAREAVPALTLTLQDKDWFVRKVAASALKQIQHHEAPPR